MLFVKKPPEFKKFKEIYHKKYKMHHYDCSNKCAEYVYHLHKNGIFSQILSIDHDGPNVSRLVYSERLGQYAIERHAIVRIFQNGRFLYADPTNFKWSSDICDFSPGCLGGITGVTNLEDFSGNEFDF